MDLETLGCRKQELMRYVIVLDSEEGFRRFHNEHPLSKALKDKIAKAKKASTSTATRSESDSTDSHKKSHSSSSKSDRKKEKKSKKHKKKSSKSSKSSSSSSSSPLWLRPNIRVRIVSEKVSTAIFQA